MTGPIGEPPLEALPPDAPATVEDVRGSRRWTWVALAWAVAASAIAVIALIQATDNKNNDQTQTTQTSSESVTPQQFEDFQKQVNDRLDAFSSRLNDKASQSDIQKLDKRLSTVESDIQQTQDNTSKQGDAVTQLQSDVKDLQQRVDDLEKQQQQSNQGADTGTTTTP